MWGKASPRCPSLSPDLLVQVLPLTPKLIPIMAEDQKPQRLQGSRPDRVRLIVMVYRKQGMSFEDFQTAWWEHVYKRQ